MRILSEVVGMTFASVFKAKPLRIVAVGLSLVALSGLPAFADTPWHGTADRGGAVRYQDRGGCDMGFDAWNRRDRRADNACAPQWNRGDAGFHGFGRNR